MSEMVVPDGWEVSSLGGHIGILSGFPFKSVEFTNNQSDIGLIRIRDLVKQQLETFYQGEFQEDYVVESGDVLVGMDGDFNVVKWNSRRALLNQRICKIQKIEGGFDVGFVHYILIPELLKIHNTTSATTVKHLSVKDIRAISRPFPPLPEQQKIASILTSVDEVIEKTQSQINKLQDLKKGTMNELLTRGVGHTEFKDSPVGRIPKGWEVTRLEGVVSSLAGGVSVNGENRAKQSGEVGVLKVSSVSGGKFIPEENKVIIDEDVHRAKLNPTADHILFSRANTPDLVGESGYVENTRMDLFLPDKLWMLDVKDREAVSIRWLSYVLASVSTRKAITDVATGTSGSMKNISKPNLLSIRIPLPQFDEQQRIASILSSIDKNIEEKHRKLEQAKSLKKSLMQDLLTGKVRVPLQ